MNNRKVLVYASVICVVVAVAVFVQLVVRSKALSYLSTDPKACINCHVMNTQYATWQHSSHARDTTCVDCHLPTDSFVDKYIAKTRDGWNHSVAFTLNTYDHAIKISDDGAKRVQKNCISCHSSLTSQIVTNADKYHSFVNPEVDTGRKCWDCHKGVPHGKVRGLRSTPDNIGVKIVK